MSTDSIKPERWKRVEALYYSALERDPSQRSAFLDEACAGDEALRREVEALLASHEEAGSFLATPALEVAAKATAAQETIPDLGWQIGNYQIHTLLGRGGMGEVYGALDTKLGREVAIKRLPESFARDAERVARFQREAELLAALNHPNIAAIHHLEEVEGARFLVLELVRGPTLAERIREGPLPLDEALGICRQIAEALETAHERGIVHRDLKPANVKITPEGTVKLLDFGLAKAVVKEEERAGSPSRFDTAAGTREGTILGTAPYVSPEQARGKNVDKRADIWAFGCVLYEALAGRVAFAEATIAETLSAILSREPDWEALPAKTPLRIRELLRRCLQKDARVRLRDIGDGRIEIDEVLAGTAPFEAVPTLAPRRYRWVLPAATALLIGALSLVILLHDRIWPPAASLRLEASVVRLTGYTGTENSGAISPDGKYFAFVSQKSGSPDIWVRQVAGGEPVQITRDEATETDLVYAPDGETLYFVAQGGIWRVGSLGGIPRKSINGGRYPAPSPDGKQLAYVRSDVGTDPSEINLGYDIEIANVDGTAPRKIYSGRGIEQLSWSPNGHWLAFTEGAVLEARKLYIINTQGQARRSLADGIHGSVFSDAWLPDSQSLVFSWSQDPFPLGNTGTDLAIVSVGGGSPRRLTLNLNARFLSPSLSSDGSRLLSTMQTFENEIWKVPLGPDPKANGAAATRLIENVWDPFWIQASRNGSTLLFNSRAAGSRNLWTVPLEGRIAPRQITSFLAKDAVTHAALSPDGRRVAFLSYQTGNCEIWVMNIDGSNPVQITHNPAEDIWPTWSPDGRWIAFASTRDGGFRQIWQVPSAGGEAVRINQEGGFRGDWSPVDNRIVYSAASRLEIADTTTGRVLLRVPFPGGQQALPVWSPDGRQFSAVRREGHLNDSIWVFDAATGQGRLAVQFPGRFHMAFRACWGKEGKFLIVNRQEIVSHIALLENF